MSNILNGQSLLYSPGQTWPEAMALDNRIMLRAAQVRVQATLNRDGKALDDDLESMLSTADETNAEAIVFACGNAGFFITETLSNLSPLRVLDRAVRMFDLVYRGIFQVDGEATSQIAGHIEDVIWLATYHLNGLDHARYFLQIVGRMSQEVLEYLFTSHLAAMSTAFLIDSIWKVEADKTH